MFYHKIYKNKILGDKTLAKYCSIFIMISALLTARRSYLTTTRLTDILTKSPEQLHAQRCENEEKQKEEKAKISNLKNM